MERDSVEPSPLELNSRLLELCAQLRPAFIPELFEQTMAGEITTEEGARLWGEMLRERGRSEHKKAFMSKLSELIGFVKGTESFKRYMVSELSGIYDIGIDKSDEDTSSKSFIDLITDISKENSGGVFDDARVRFIELMTFTNMLKEKISAEERFIEMFQESRRNRLERIFDADVTTWMQEFKEKYETND